MGSEVDVRPGVGTPLAGVGVVDGAGALGEGLVAGVTGAGLCGRRTAAAALPPTSSRHVPAAATATRRRWTRLPRSVMCAAGAASARACP
ncbi:hypothetical protein [Streptomyces sp. NPDC051452]|uniref:hypothetical protein n=1 Tax=Streptomyces sp. NPDC051452 TaxID=3365654 RepID=UPI0037B8E7EF